MKSAKLQFHWLFNYWRSQKSNHLGQSLSYSKNNSTDCISSISSIRIICPIIMGHLNIISLQNKFKVIKNVFCNNIDVFFLSETKLDETFPSNELQIEGYKNFKLDRNCIESICLELHLRKRKWLVIGIYKPPSYSKDAFIKSLFFV